MKHREKLPDEYRHLKHKIFLRAFLFFFAAGGIIWLLYRFVLSGHIANWMVALFTRLFRMDPDAALSLYWQVFRRNSDLILFIGIVVIFFVIFRVYLNWFTQYFVKINKGIDALITEDAGEVVLSPELRATERKINAIKHTLQRRKQDAQFAEQQKNDLIVYLAHDLKTPLTTVIGYLTLLRDEPDLPREARVKYAGIALDKAERLESLINEFFDITRFSLTQLTLDEQTINLTRMLEQIAHELQPILAERALTIDTQLEPGVQISCDPDKLRRVFDNIFRNAVHYSYANTAIAVSLIRRGEAIVIRVANHGKTIAPERLGRIFDPFYRLDSARSAATGGAGLGLAIAREIVELHGGTIAAESENEQIALTVTLARDRQKIV